MLDDSTVYEAEVEFRASQTHLYDLVDEVSEVKDLLQSNMIGAYLKENFFKVLPGEGYRLHDW